MQALLQNVRYSLRQIVRYPGFAASIALTLALGIAANTAIFSLVHAVLLRPLPYANGGRLVHIGYRDPAPDVKDLSFSVQEMRDLQQQTRSLASIEEYHSMVFTLLGPGEPDRVRTGVVSAGFFNHFGVKPLLGRSFLPGEDKPGAEPVVLLTYPYWQKHFAANPAILDKSVVLDGKAARIVGILPLIPQFPRENDVYVPSAACSVRTSDFITTTRKARMLSLFGRLNPGASVTAARAEIAAIVGTWRRAQADLYPEEDYHDVPVVAVQDEVTRSFKPTLIILLAVVGLVLLLACLNVANLTLARMMRREREVAVRSALGAGRGRLVSQLLTESTVLALLGGAVGLLLARAALKLLVAFAERFTVRASEVSIDASVLLFTLLISLLTGLLFGLYPAFQASVRNAAAALKAGAGRATGNVAGRRARALLTIAQVAISFVLLIGAALSVRSFRNLQQVDTGFDLHNVVAMTLTLSSSRATVADRLAFYEPLLARIEALPGVAAAGLANYLPLEGEGFEPAFEIEGRPASDDMKASFDIASDGLFRTLRTALVSGRTFTAGDNQEAPPVIIINQAFARRFWPGQDPIGQHITFKYRSSDNRPATIVGVVKDAKRTGLESETGPAFYKPFRQGAGMEMRLFVRSLGDPRQLVPAIVGAVHTMDPQLPVADIRTLEEVRDQALARVRLTAILLTVFAAVASTIAVIGISGVVGSAVTERTREIGIRSALGAGPGQLLGGVLWQGMAPVAIGLVLGVAGALGLTRFLSSLLYGVAPNDPVTYAAVAALLLAASLFACLVPARHAVSIDPLLALRYE